MLTIHKTLIRLKNVSETFVKLYFDKLYNYETQQDMCTVYPLSSKIWI